jgi:hypothetical protein
VRKSEEEAELDELVEKVREMHEELERFKKEAKTCVLLCCEWKS